MATYGTLATTTVTVTSTQSASNVWTKKHLLVSTVDFRPSLTSCNIKNQLENNESLFVVVLLLYTMFCTLYNGTNLYKSYAILLVPLSSKIKSAKI